MGGNPRKQQAPMRMCIKWTSHTLLAGMYNGSAAVENSLAVPQKLNMELLYNLVTRLLDIYLKTDNRPSSIHTTCS